MKLKEKLERKLNREQMSEVFNFDEESESIKENQEKSKPNHCESPAHIISRKVCIGAEKL